MIQRGEGDVKAFRSFCLVPVTFLKHVDNDLPLAFFHDVKERSVTPRFDQRERTPSDDRIGEELRPDLRAGRKNHGALNHIFKFADIPGP